MTYTITTISGGGVNCFLVRSGSGCVLIDTGFASRRTELEQALAGQGCTPDALRLVVLTHGDVDHAGNCAYLQQKYGVPVAIHPDDARMVETGDMRWNRKDTPDHMALLFRIFSLLDRTPDLETCIPDLLLNDGDRLSDYGLDATVIALPGHSKGSIGILTGAGDLFCGDLLANIFKPGLQMYIDDMAAATTSLARLRALPITTIYPGHGKPFMLSALE